jgi:multiple sugar transport system permease protein
MLSDERFGNALQNTSIFTIGTVATEMAIGLLVALSISRLKPRIAEKVNVVSVIPIVMTPVITGILWRMIMHGDYGILNYYLSMLGLGRYSWLSDPKLTLFSNMIVDIWHWTPFVALAFTAGISAIPREPLEAAQLDGASYWQTFKNIMLPYLRTILMLVLLLRVVEAILFFDINFILTKGGPGVRSEMVSLYVYKNAFWFWNLGYSSALSYIVLIIADIIGMALFFIVIGRKKK